MRVKEVTFEGQTFKIAPLNLEQVEKIFPAKEDGTVVTFRGWDGAVEVITSGLNNALASEIEWTPARVRKELDFPTMKWLRDQISDFSELSGTPEKKDPEAPAPAAPAVVQ